jgi:GT2 family glycosyltransferase
MLNHAPLVAEEPSQSNTAAVVVLFHPEGELVARLQRVMKQVAILLVISNDGEDHARLAGLDIARLTHVQAEGNIGLAAALNQGLAQAAQHGFTWCLLLDQDTLIDDDLVIGLAEAHTACPSRSKVGVLAPNYRSPGAGARLAYPSDTIWQPMETAVTSGSLVALETVRRVGGMREAFFIEGIDLEFSLRVRSAGLQLVASGRPLMTHGAGATEERRFFGRTVLVGHHPPWRCFLQFRNLAWTLWRYGKKEPHWARVTLVSILKRFCITFLFERQRLRKAWAMLSGFTVGLVQASSKNNRLCDLPGLK